MWRIFGVIFFRDKEYFLEKDRKCFNKELIVEFLNKKGIALFDTAIAVRRLQDNASDKYLEVAEQTNILRLLDKIPHCKAIVTTGQKATDTIRMQIVVGEPPVGSFTEFYLHDKAMRLYRMPSSSRAYPLSLDKKAEVYRHMFKELALI